ncbi:iron chelate uptake ABC transporter family permease subunit [Otariodibacter sp.]|uniref:iron chelate uptake ABC transporter family permease subunit n=1 Tax=Otariodibacter sp. TaxID=3030919 RepID=UPI002601EEB3|nr:iron chelate uptake ABC transporter family permease subunit [Otariodibacter sp.]
MTLNNRGAWDFILLFRGKKLLLLLIVAYAIGVSTLLFQSLTNNPILTPSILGFDALYLLLQTLLVFVLGTISYIQLDSLSKFGFETALMIIASILLFRLLNKNNNSGDNELGRVILVGVIFGILFRSLNQLLQRLLDPMQFAIVQGAYFAEFNTVKEPIIWFALILVIISAIFIWQLRFRLDVIALGKSTAISLGISYQRCSFVILMWIAILLSISTALVGPVSFFGLLVCALTNALSPTASHGIRLPIVFMLSAITLILGQAIFEHLFNMKTILSVIVECIGGIVFLFLILGRKK